MIFKTFQSDLNGISNKIGFSKRSFTEWGKQVSTSFKESEGVVNSFKKALKTAFTVPIEKNNDWIKNNLDDIVNKENIDSFIPELTLENSKKLTEQIREQSIAVASGSKNWDNYFNELEKRGHGYIVDLIKNTDDLSKLTGKDLVKANQKARASALAHNEAIKAQTLSAKASAVAFRAVSMAGNMILFAAIAKGIQLATKAIDDHIHKVDRAGERTEELLSEFQQMNDTLADHKKTVSELADRYDELSKGVSNIDNSNISLSDEEYNEFLDINKQPKIEILNSTLRQFSGIYLCKSGVYSFTYQCYTLSALLTAVEGGIP